MPHVLEFVTVEMGCVEARRLLTDYIDGDLEPPTLARAIHHQEKCAHCRAIFDGTRNVVELLGKFAESEPPEDFGCRLPSRPPWPGDRKLAQGGYDA